VILIHLFMEMGGAHWLSGCWVVGLLVVGLLVVGLLGCWVVGLLFVEKIHEFSLHANNMMGGIHPSIITPRCPPG
jgi:hypothetical protein